MSDRGCRHQRKPEADQGQSEENIATSPERARRRMWENGPQQPPTRAQTEDACIDGEDADVCQYLEHMVSGQRSTLYDRVVERRRAVPLARHLRDAEGLSIAQIAVRLSCAPATAKAYFYDPTDANKRPTTTRNEGGRELRSHLRAAAPEGELFPDRWTLFVLERAVQHVRQAWGSDARPCHGTAPRLARHYRDQEGLAIAEIPRRLGCAQATIKAYLYDPTGDKARAVKARCRGVCRGCGAPTAPRNGKGDAYAYCKRCHPGAIAPEWTPERVREAMRAWRGIAVRDGLGTLAGHRFVLARGDLCAWTSFAAFAIAVAVKLDSAEPARAPGRPGGRFAPLALLAQPKARLSGPPGYYSLHVEPDDSCMVLATLEYEEAQARPISGSRTNHRHASRSRGRPPLDGRLDVCPRRRSAQAAAADFGRDAFVLGEPL
jgi:hypothetical protein